MLVFSENGVGTHVLLVGIDQYSAGNIPALPAAVTSAKALSDWWNGGFVNHGAPLRSLELISGPEASFDTLAKAIRSWHDRAISDPENIAIFYFAGHGLQTSAGYSLLASDLGFQPNESSASAAADQAILVDDLVDAFSTGPVRQLWLFDTARETATDQSSHIRPRNPLTVQQRASVPLQRTILYAARAGGLALTAPQGPSDFARAFLDTVQAQPERLDTATLAEEMSRKVRQIRGDIAASGMEVQSTASFQLLDTTEQTSATVGSGQGTTEATRPDAAGNAPTSPTSGPSEPRGARKSATAPSEQDSDSNLSAPARGTNPCSPSSPPPDLEFLDDYAQVEIDTLGRGTLAIVVARRLHAIWRKSNPAGLDRSVDDRSGFVMHLDAPWGGGKTTFANFIARVLNPYGYGSNPARFLRDRYGAASGLGAIFAADPPRPGDPSPPLPEDHRRPWIVIEYNAWRMEHTSPPWWTFYQVIRKGCFRSILIEGDRPVDMATATLPANHTIRDSLRWSWLWVNELRWRLWTPKLIIPLSAFALSASIFLLLWRLGWIGVTGQGKDEVLGFNKAVVAGRILTGLGALTILGGAASLILESLAPGVDPVAERLGLGRSDPLERFRRHFHKTMCRLKRPVLVVVDDLDRCKPAVIVDLIRGIQTILRSPRIVFLVLGDRNWLECAFEIVHTDMAKVVGGEEQTVGARFVEKAIQLSFLLPGLDPKQQKTFIAELLQTGTSNASEVSPPPSVDLRATARAAAKAEPGAAFDTDRFRSVILETEEGKEFLANATDRLRQADATAEPIDMQAEARRQAAQIVNEEIAIQAAVATSVEAETARRLEPLGPWLPGNPRQIKRVLNGIALYHAAGLQHPTFSTSERWFQLALWVVLMTEWPKTWRLVSSCPELADVLCAEDPLSQLPLVDAAVLPGSLAATQRELQRILSSSDLMALIAGHGGRAGAKLDTTAVRELLSLTPPNSKLPRLPEPETKPTDNPIPRKP